MERFSPAVSRVLRDAGWRLGRSVDIASWRLELEGCGFVMHDAAEEFLSEFGGLTVDISGPGITSAREPFELDPMLCCGEEDRFSEWSEVLGRFLCPLGELDSGRYFLGLDEDSEVYLVECWLASFGVMPVALENLILGVAPKVLAGNMNTGIDSTEYFLG